MTSRGGKRLVIGATVALTMALMCGCSSDNKKAGGPNYDYTYFERQQAAQEAERAKVTTQGLWSNEGGSGRRFGVILPLDSSLRRAGESVMSGMLAGYWADNQNARARLMIYREGQYKNIFAAYKKAVQNGAEVVIGPLPKDSVRALVETTPIGTPTIALNAASRANFGEPNLYQFSLSLEEEAENAARILYGSGYKRVFMLYEDNEVGNRAMRKFQSEMLRLGGVVPNPVEFSTRNSSYEAPAERIAEATYREKLFSVNPKEQRYAVYRKADAMFVAGERNGIEGMVWALRQAGIKDLPIVTTSNANVKDHEVKGVYIVDIPWLVDSKLRSAVWARTAPGFRSEALSFDPRLFAMGMDSYRLAQNLEWMNANRSRSLEGVTGTLTISQKGHVNRAMVLGKIERGKMLEAKLPAFDEKQRRPIHDIVVRDGRETIVASNETRGSTLFWRNPFSSVRF